MNYNLLVFNVKHNTFKGEIIMKIALINENSQASKNELRNKAKIAKIYKLFYHSKSKLNI